MDIDKNIASMIVTNLKSALSYDINLFDTTGTIIASTNPQRIGTSHGAAQLAIETGYTVYVDDDHPFAGARDGVNIPVYLYGNIVAVIGMTGKREEVESYGNVIRKMTEILIRENLDRMNYSDHTILIENLIDALTTSEKYDPVTISHLFQEANITIQDSYYCIVAQLGNDLLNSQEIRQLRDEISQITSHLSGLLISIKSDGFCLIVPTSPSDKHLDDQALTEDDISISQLCSAISSSPMITNKNCSIGVGSIYPGLASIRTSYHEAKSAAQWASTQNTHEPVDYKDLDIGVLIPSLSKESISVFLSRIFANLSDEQIQKFAELFHSYKMHNGSINHTAQELYLHKNTVQNRLNKLMNYTGYNPRNLRDFSVLDCAFELYQWQAKENQN
ncbi:CdaR family transcriptional regulator [Alloscardovia venturai]|uniref:CdaR family transcriptional regulator n=1 Tax=Alloscardovia venturai TaxID=1769421 RepID=A0ABW2Y527_9BIFI